MFEPMSALGCRHGILARGDDVRMDYDNVSSGTAEFIDKRFLGGA